MPLPPFPTEHPFKDDGIGAPFALVRGIGEENEEWGLAILRRRGREKNNHFEEERE